MGNKKILSGTILTEGEWKGFQINTEEDLNDIKPLLRSNHEKYKK